MYIYIILIIILLFIYYRQRYGQDRTENFCYNCAPVGRCQYPKPPFREPLIFSRDIAHKWETRYPSLVKQRYSHKDLPTCKNLYGIKGKGRLCELPLALRNRWFATQLI